MGAFLDKPKTDKHTADGSGNGLRFGLSSMQGWRVEMEDAHCAVTGLPGNLSKWSFFAVFDGHAGALVSARCAEQLLEAIVQTDDFKNLDPDTAPPLEDVKRGIIEGFLSLDSRLRQMPEVETGEDKSGSTAVCVLVSPSHIFFANCGDSRGILVRDGQVMLATEDHKPINPAERARIQNAGGSVMIQRVNGSLAVSRSLGDYDYKNVSGMGPTEQLVSPEPEVFIQDRCPDKDEFIVLACDGVWDVMSNDDVCHFVSHRARIEANLSQICNDVVDTCLHKGSRDNMSIIIVAFDNAPGVSAEAQEADKQVDKELAEKVTDIIAKFNERPPMESSSIDMHSILIELQSTYDSAKLPPGGGLASKRAVVEAVYKRLAPAEGSSN